MYTHIEENYLKALLALSIDNEDVSVNELSKKLGIKMPSVTNMMQKFSEKELVHYDLYKPIKLSEIGKKQAALILRKHRLVEMYLVKKLNFNWDEVHDIAEQIEHVNSELFFDKIDEVLGFPKFDPHGSFIPDKSGKFKIDKIKKLSNCKVGDSLIVIGVSDSTSSFLKFLSFKNILLGTSILINYIEKYDQSINLLINKKINHTLSKEICEKIFIENELV